jgi:hypothetical protein
MWEYRYKGLKLAQLLSQLGIFLTLSVSRVGRQWSIDGSGDAGAVSIARAGAGPVTGSTAGCAIVDIDQLASSP